MQIRWLLLVSTVALCTLAADIQDVTSPPSDPSTRAGTSHDHQPGRTITEQKPDETAVEEWTKTLSGLDVSRTDAEWRSKMHKHYASKHCIDLFSTPPTLSAAYLAGVTTQMPCKVARHMSRFDIIRTAGEIWNFGWRAIAVPYEVAILGGVNGFFAAKQLRKCYSQTKRARRMAEYCETFRNGIEAAKQGDAREIEKFRSILSDIEDQVGECLREMDLPNDDQTSSHRGEGESDSRHGRIEQVVSPGTSSMSLSSQVRPRRQRLNTATSAASLGPSSHLNPLSLQRSTRREWEKARNDWDIGHTTTKIAGVIVHGKIDPYQIDQGFNPDREDPFIGDLMETPHNLVKKVSRPSQLDFDALAASLPPDQRGSAQRQ